jgi:hypothetical protein
VAARIGWPYHGDIEPREPGKRSFRACYAKMACFEKNAAKNYDREGGV